MHHTAPPDPAALRKRSTCGEYLKRWGYTPQKPARRAYEQNPKAVKEWMEVAYPQIARQAKAEGAEIHWGDEMGVRSDCQHGRSYRMVAWRYEGRRLYLCIFTFR